MKKIQFFIFCIGIVFLSSCANPASENSESSNAKLTAIHNFSSYKGIGVGTPNVSGNSSARTIYSDDDLKLIGQKGDGSIEVITFDDESGAEQKQTYHLSCYTNRNSFIFMGFSDYKTTRIESDALYNHTINYILDKKTGKLYSLDFNSSMFDIGPEFDGKIIIGATINNIEGMYFFSIQDNLLKIELIADYETIPVNSYSIRLYTQVDRYGNFFTNEDEMRRYIITKSGRIKKVPYDFNLCVNGIFYNAYDSDHITHWIDENGECVTATYIPTYYFQMMDDSSYLLNTSSKDLISYIWGSYEYESEEMLAIGKLTFTDDTKSRYNYEIVASKPYIYKNTPVSYFFNKTGRVIYISEDLSVVTFLDVMTGEYTDILSLSNVLRVKNTETDKYENVVISYVDNDLNTINYYIDKDGNYSTSFKEPEYIIKYITPIN